VLDAAVGDSTTDVAAAGTDVAAAGTDVAASGADVAGRAATDEPEYGEPSAADPAEVVVGEPGEPASTIRFDEELATIRMTPATTAAMTSTAPTTQTQAGRRRRPDSPDGCFA